MDKWVVTIYGFSGKLMERIGGFTSKAEADDVAARKFQRGDVGSVHVQKEQPAVQQGDGRYR